MPNRFHGLIFLSEVGTAGRAATTTGHPGSGTAGRAATEERFQKPVPGSLPTIIRSFKSASTRRINRLRRAEGMPVWQRNYYEHVIRNEDELFRARTYIRENPLKWELDPENTSNAESRYEIHA